MKKDYVMAPAVLKNYVGGHWIEPENQGCLDVENPATAETISQVPLSTPVEVDRGRPMKEN